MVDDQDFDRSADKQRQASAAARMASRLAFQRPQDWRPDTRIPFLVVGNRMIGPAGAQERDRSREAGGPRRAVWSAGSARHGQSHHGRVSMHAH